MLQGDEYATELLMAVASHLSKNHYRPAVFENMCGIAYLVNQEGALQVDVDQLVHASSVVETTSP